MNFFKFIATVGICYCSITLLYCQTTETIVADSLEYPMLNKIQTQTGICLEVRGFGNGLNRDQLTGEKSFSGFYDVFLCDSSLVYFTFTEMDRVFLSVEDSSISFCKFSYFLSPNTKKYDTLQCYEISSIFLTSSGELQAKTEYPYIYPKLSAETITSFVEKLDNIFEDDQLLLKSANGYFFSEVLFYCAMAGDKKAQFYFQNMLEILEERGLLSEYGGEPAQIHAELKGIYINSKPRNK